MDNTVELLKLKDKETRLKAAEKCEWAVGEPQFGLEQFTRSIKG